MEATVQKKEHFIAVLDRTGDTKTTWDPDNQAEVDAARATFDKLKGEGFVIYRVNPTTGEPGTVMHKFDPEAEKLIARRRVVGG